MQAWLCVSPELQINLMLIQHTLNPKIVACCVQSNTFVGSLNVLDQLILIAAIKGVPGWKQ